MPMGDNLRKRAGRSWSRLEALLALGTGAAAEPLAGIAGLGGLLTGGLDRGVRNIDATRSALTYQPRDPRGMQELGQVFGSFVGRDPYTGQIEAGNIDLANRPVVRNPDGSISTVRSISANFDGHEVLIPTVSEDGRILSDDDAIEAFRRTGRHLGKFDSVDAATRYAESLHNDQSALYGRSR